MLKIYLKILYLVLICTVTLFSDTFEESEQRSRQRDILENLNKDRSFEGSDIPSSVFVPQTSSLNDHCFEIYNVNTSEASLIGRYKIDKIILKYLNRCDTLTDLKNLTDELSSLYIDRGYITSRFYLSPQNISEGNVTLKALEGKVGDIFPNDLSTISAFAGQKEKYLNIRDIEAALDSINRLPSNRAVMKLAPSNNTGYTDIIVENVPTKRFGASASIDNYGGKQTGRAQITGRANMDNIIGFNDQLNIFFNSSNKHFTDEDSIGNGYDYSFVVGRALFTYSQRNSKFDQKVKTGASEFYSRGRSKTHSFDTRYKLYHDQTNRINVGMTLSNYVTKNSFAEVHLDSSSYRLSKLGLNADYVYQIPGFYAYASLSYTKGAGLFHNYHSSALDDGYEFYNLSLSAVKDLGPFRYSLNAHSQFTKDSLFGTDRISIGGVHSVRGYEARGLSGNSGYYARNELSYNKRLNIFGGLTSNLFLSLDQGAIKSDESSFGGKLLSYSIGSKLQSDNLEASIHYSIPSYKKDVKETSNFLGVSVRAKF